MISSSAPSVMNRLIVWSSPITPRAA